MMYRIQIASHGSEIYAYMCLNFEQEQWRYFAWVSARWSPGHELKDRADKPHDGIKPDEQSFIK